MADAGANMGDLVCRPHRAPAARPMAFSDVYQHVVVPLRFGATACPFPRKVTADIESVACLPEVLRRWVRWPGRRRGLAPNRL